MADDFISKLKKVATEFEKNARPKIEKALDECGKKAEDLKTKAAKEAGDAARIAKDKGQEIAGRVRREWEAVVGTALKQIGHTPVDENTPVDGNTRDPRHHYSHNPKSTNNGSQPSSAAAGGFGQSPAVPYDISGTVEDILYKMKNEDETRAVKKLTRLRQEISEGRVDPRQIDMTPIVESVTEQHEAGKVEGAKILVFWSKELIEKGADVSKVDSAPIRKLVENKLAEQDFGTARELMLWARYVEAAVSSSSRPVSPSAPSKPDGSSTSPGPKL